MRRIFVLLLILGSLCACAPAEPMVVVPVTVVAGPTCPVISDPPDPACDDRPVDGAELLVMGANGQQVAAVRSDARGRADLHLAIGSYTVRPQPVEGLMGTAAQVALVVSASPEALVISYDTGIR
ncbi:MAG: hypothetical protein ABI622_10955 [Chloroflexota bacterium]